MAITIVGVNRKRDELKAKRNRLFEKYLKNPGETTLALEIKQMDDELAEYSEQRALKLKPKN